jgi:hypothetical protein
LKFSERVKGAVSAAKTKYNDSRTNSRLKNADLCLYSDAWRVVYPEFESLIGRKEWSRPAPGTSQEDFKAEISEILSRIWPDDYDPEFLSGSVCAIFNFTILYFVCSLDLDTTEAKFMNTLNRALQESSIEDIYPYFEREIWADNPAEKNLSQLIPTYVKRHFPKLPISAAMSEVQAKLDLRSQLNQLKSAGEFPIFLSEGLRGSSIEAGSGPNANLARYIEYYSPEHMAEEGITFMYYMHQSLKPNPNQAQRHWLFCSNGILIVPDKNNGYVPSWIPIDDVNSILFGLAYDALTENNVTKYETYKLFMYIDTADGATNILYKYLGDTQTEAKKEIISFQQDTLPLIGSVYNADWTEEIIDESSHYVTRTTTTTYWTWG